MKKIIWTLLFALFLSGFFVTSVFASTIKTEQFTTHINASNNGTVLRLYTEQGFLDQWTCNGTLTGNSYTNYPVRLSRDIEYSELMLGNLTTVMERLVETNRLLVDYGNDTKTYKEKYVECTEAWARVTERYDVCREELKKTEGCGDALQTCQIELSNERSQRNLILSEKNTMEQELKEEQDGGMTKYLIGIIIGGGGIYVLFVMKPFKTSEEKQFGG